jgi:hypothetical protein
MAQMCQIALKFFNLFKFEADGLLCDETLSSMQAFYDGFGVDDIADVSKDIISRLYLIFDREKSSGLIQVYLQLS